MYYHRAILATIGLSLFAACWQWPGQAIGQVNIDVGGIHVQVGNRPPPPSEGVVVLTRGPLHEAFAQPVIFDEGTAFTIANRPPAPIDEVPPEIKPEGDNIVWIPGYWSWDTDRNDFIWVSGCWRAVPPNTSWVPGYWAQSGQGYQWVPGFWTGANTQELEYLPAPPATLEEGPQGAGSPDSIWIPGIWERHEGRYAWRSGFWERARPDWVWVPAEYVLTPRGWVYVDGYWDYPLDRRGVAFSPIYAPYSLYGRRDFRYSPDYALDLGGLLFNLFVSPRRHQYYYGDYYGSEYSREGYYPWYQSSQRHDWYDPIYVQQQWQHRGDRNWASNQRTWYDRRLNNQSLRPARTYDAMAAQAARLPVQDRSQVQTVVPLRQAVAAQTTPFKYNTLDTKTRETTASQARDVHAYKDKRSKWESAPAASKTPVAPTPVAPTAVAPTPTAPTPVAPMGPTRTPGRVAPLAPEKTTPPVAQPLTPPRGPAVREQPARQEVPSQKVAVPRSPITAREPVHSKELTPPPRPEHPKPDATVQPRPSKADTRDHSKDKEVSDQPDSKRK